MINIQLECERERERFFFQSQKKDLLVYFYMKSKIAKIFSQNNKKWKRRKEEMFFSN